MLHTLIITWLSLNASPPCVLYRDAPAGGPPWSSAGVQVTPLTQRLSQWARRRRASSSQSSAEGRGGGGASISDPRPLPPPSCCLPAGTFRMSSAPRSDGSRPFLTGPSHKVLIPNWQSGTRGREHRGCFKSSCWGWIWAGGGNYMIYFPKQSRRCEEMFPLWSAGCPV